MGGAVFILAINLAVAAVLATGFVIIAAYGRAYASARWIAAAYGLGVAYYLFEFAIRFEPDSVTVATLAYASFLAALGAYAVGLTGKFEVRPPWALIGVLFVVSIAVNIYAQGLPRDTLLRNMLWQVPYALMQSVAIGVVLAARSRTLLDNALAGLLAASTLHFVAKPLIAMTAGGPGIGPQTYLETTYAMASQSLSSIFAFSVALLTVAIYVRTMLTDALLNSRTDPLSGLLNRRGFEDRSDELLLASARSGVPLSIVIADIDHFKAVNDSYGHETGDRVIQAFARTLDHGSGSHSVGRIGGEEFAIMVAGGELQTARLIAVGIRIAFAELPIPGLAGQRCTASFGVAEWRVGETYGDLVRRADMALYEAKNAGRDCVRLAPPAKTAPTAVNDQRQRRMWQRDG